MQRNFQGRRQGEESLTMKITPELKVTSKCTENEKKNQRKVCAWSHPGREGEMAANQAGRQGRENSQTLGISCVLPLSLL